MTTKLMGLKGLCEANGEIHAEDFADRLSEAYTDLEDRPHEKGARTITLTVKLTPERASNGSLESVSMYVDSKLSKPKRRGNRIALKRGRGGIFFSEFPDDVEGQEHLFPGPKAASDEQGDGTNG